MNKGVFVNKAQLADSLVDHFGGSRRAAAAAVDAVFDTIVAAVAKGDKVAIAGFGNFEKKARKARTARNPLTGATVKVKATSVAKFRPAMAFKESVASGKASGPKKVVAAAPKKAAKKAAKKSSAKKSAKKVTKKAGAKKAGKKPARKAAKKKK